MGINSPSYGGRFRDSGPYHTVARGDTAQHPEGTYGKFKTINTLELIAENYFKKVKRKLSVNDLSLPKGGLFDVHFNWRPGHKSHRTGTDADINQAGVPCNLDKKLRKSVKEAGAYLSCEDTQGKPDPNGPFKHIDFD